MWANMEADPAPAWPLEDTEAPGVTLHQDHLPEPHLDPWPSDTVRLQTLVVFSYDSLGWLAGQQWVTNVPLPLGTFQNTSSFLAPRVLSHGPTRRRASLPSGTRCFTSPDLADPSSGRPRPPSQHIPLPRLSSNVTSSVSPPHLPPPITPAQGVPVRTSQRHPLPCSRLACLPS